MTRYRITMADGSSKITFTKTLADAMAKATRLGLHPVGGKTVAGLGEA